MAKPQIRIKGYDEEWEDITLNDICTINPPSIVPEVFEYVDLESVVGTEIVAHRTETRSTAPSRAISKPRTELCFLDRLCPDKAFNL